LNINSNGQLIINTSLGDVVDEAPISYQDNQKINTAYLLKDHLLSFKVANYDFNKTIILDPSIVWSTYFGGVGIDNACQIKTDIIGNVFLCGITHSPALIATVGSNSSTYINGLTNGFLVKFNSNGVRQWSTYLQGVLDSSFCMTTDQSCRIVVGYRTSTQGLASSNSYQSSLNGYQDIILTKFDSLGNKLWATYIGGGDCFNGNTNVGETITDLASDINSNIYILGRTCSFSNISTPGSYISSIGSGNGQSGFIMKFNLNGSRIWGTYLGYSFGNSEGLFSIAVSNSGSVYLVGASSFLINPSPNAFQTSNGGNKDGIIMKLNSAGTNVIWSTYYGGYGNDAFYSVKLDGSNKLIILGQTSSANMSTTSNSQQPIIASDNQDMFICKFDTLGSRIWATYYNCGLDNYLNNTYIKPALCLDSQNNVYIASTTTYSTLATSNAIQTQINGATDLFILKLTSTGLRDWFTYIGGNDIESDASIAAANTQLYLAGTTKSYLGIATSGAHTENLINNLSDAFILKLETMNCTSNISILNQPLSINTCVGQLAKFTISTNSSTAQYQWQYLPPSGVWTNVTTGGNLNTFTTYATLALNSFKYRCVVSCLNSVTSNSATLSVSNNNTGLINGNSTYCNAVNSTGPGIVAIGTGTASLQWLPTFSGLTSSKVQYLIRANELINSSVVAGYITSLSILLQTPISLGYCSNLEIKMGLTNQNSLTSYIVGLNPVYQSSATYLDTTSNIIKTFKFTSPFLWDGISNIVIQFCHNNDPIGNCPNCYSGYAFNTNAQGITTNYVSTYADGNYPNSFYMADRCSQSQTATWTYNSRPVFKFEANVNYPGTTLTANSIGSYLWNTGQTTQSVYVSSGNYTVTVTAANGCTTNSTINISASTVPTIISQPSSTTVCNASNATFSLSTNLSNVQYQWQGKTASQTTWTNLINGTNYAGVNTNTLTVIGATSSLNNYQYRCQASCSGYITSSVVVLTVRPIITSTINPQICQGSSYTINGNTYNQPGTYQVYLTSYLGCDSIVTVNLSYSSNSASSIYINGGNINTPQTSITLGDYLPLQLSASLSATNPNIIWTPNTNISNNSVTNPMVNPTSNTQYIVSFNNSNGCLSRDTILVNVTGTAIGTVNLTSPDPTVNYFDTLVVNVSFSNMNNLYSFYSKLKFNSNVSTYLTYIGYNQPGLLGSGASIITTPPTVTTSSYDFGVTKAGSQAGFNGNGIFYTFYFVVKNISSIPNGTQFCFYLDDFSIFNSGGQSRGVTNGGQQCFTYSNGVNVWPGDLDNNKVVNTTDLLRIGTFYNYTGPARTNASLLWVAQPATLWGQDKSTANSSAYYVFADGNGDGIINNADQSSIGFNLGQSHPLVSQLDSLLYLEKIRNLNMSGSIVAIPTPPFVNTTQLPTTTSLSINLVNQGGSQLDSLNGISFSVEIDTNVYDLSNITYDYSNSIFGLVNVDFIKIEYVSGGLVNVALTRLGNGPINGNGTLCKMILPTRSIISNSNNNCSFNVNVDAATNPSGGQFTIPPAISTIVVSPTASINDIQKSNVVVTPNPFNESIVILNKSNLNVLHYRLIDAQGKLVFEGDMDNDSYRIDASKLANGVYFLTITNQLDSSNLIYKLVK
jgi:hypothetical protein